MEACVIETIHDRKIIEIWMEVPPHMYDACRVMLTHSLSPRIELVVEFVDGVTQLELMKKADELKVVANTTCSLIQTLLK